MIWYFLVISLFVAALFADHYKEQIIEFFKTQQLPQVSIKRTPWMFIKEQIAKFKQARYEKEQARIKAIQESRARIREMREQVMRKGRLERSSTNTWVQEELRKHVVQNRLKNPSDAIKKKWK